ncbi:MAG: crossover junction endodeoxyribonuclease RuvC [Magnetococcales bacterium]|nr:crossover junction endodeoxyribonuclease RuvC [Magnetococcales bacterium]MBF0151820.1 crossover junction endodeoxyribonuclease RuvC [Magnetococcales bacterium]MBF0174587.1 crossover junction endodeoxyribonuclease RuvC [Magnetococcales bacterium]MBF0346742.1 crossover junction endodeoxyribonuclease RuvC [Magnetococcales bacterium]MBF0630375.1 crossover junction endodeoxyribonuclease RuvC [Magnetococcales bacterium]
MRVLGIDPGLSATGWGIVESNGHTYRAVAHGSIRSDTASALPVRLGEIFSGIQRVIVTHQPQLAVVEEIFIARNPTSALKLGHARGVAIAAANQGGLPVYEYTALQIKKAVVGYGRAEKPQVQEMVRVLLSMPRKAAVDASDALAAALCHLNQSPLLRLAGQRAS